MQSNLSHTNITLHLNKKCVRKKTAGLNNATPGWTVKKVTIYWNNKPPEWTSRINWRFTKCTDRMNCKNIYNLLEQWTPFTQTTSVSENKLNANSSWTKQILPFTWTKSVRELSSRQSIAKSSWTEQTLPLSSTTSVCANKLVVYTVQSQAEPKQISFT